MPAVSQQKGGGGFFPTPGYTVSQRNGGGLVTATTSDCASKKQKRVTEVDLFPLGACCKSAERWWRLFPHSAAPESQQNGSGLVTATTSDFAKENESG